MILDLWIRCFYCLHNFSILSEEIGEYIYVEIALLLSFGVGSKDFKRFTPCCFLVVSLCQRFLVD